MRNPTPTGDRESFITGGVLGCFVLLIVNVYFLMNVASPFSGDLVDPDSYMRLVRVLHMMETGDWYNPIISRGGEVSGETSHWTHPMDILLMAGAVPLSHFFPAREALLFWVPGLMLLLGGAVVFSGMWAVRPFLAPRAHVFAGLLLIAQAGVIVNIMAARPDHHVLIIFFFLIALGVALRMAEEICSDKTALVGGIAAGLSVWVSVESLTLLVMIYGGLGFLWCLGRSNQARNLTAFSVGLFATMIVALLIERPPSNLLMVEYDRFSVVHVVLSLLMVCVWSCFARIGVREARIFPRFAIATLATVVAGGIMALLFPAFLLGPVGVLPQRVIEVYFGHVPNDHGSFFMPDGVPFSELFLCLGNAIAGVFFVLWGYFYKPNFRNRHVFLLLGLSFFIVLTFIWPRLFIYAQLMALLPFLGILEEIQGRFVALSERQGILLDAFAVFFLATAFSYVPAIFAPQRENTFMCNPAQLVELMEKASWGKDYSHHIFADPRDAPELLLRSGHSFFTTGYHRNSRRIIQSYDIMTTVELAAVRDFFDRYKVEAVLVCADPFRDHVYGEKSRPEIFYNRLKNNQLPPWLRLVASRNFGPTSYRLLEVVEP